MDELSINKECVPFKTFIHIKASPAGVTYILYYRDSLASKTTLAQSSNHSVLLIQR